MQDQEIPVRDFVDRSLRELLSKPVNLRGFLASVVPKLIDGFDFDAMQPARREYFLGNWRSREADLLFEIPYHLPDRDETALVCILLEHQTRADWRTPLVTLIYAVLYWEWQLRQWEALTLPRADFKLRPILPVVLHTGARPWGTVKTLRDLLVEPEVFRPLLPDWQPLFWELAEHSPDELLRAPDAILQVLALLRVEKEALPAAMRAFSEAMQQLDPLSKSQPVRWQDMIKFAVGWMMHRRPQEERPTWTALAEQLQADEQRRQEIKAMSMTIADSIRLEGKLEGKLEAVHGLLMKLARRKFGEPDVAILRTFQAIADVERLDRMSTSIFEVNSWADLLSVL